jgi:hypothetical protein
MKFLRMLIGFILLFIVMHFLAKMVHADEYKDLSREFNQIYAEQIRVRVQKFPKKSFVEISLKDGTVVRGIFEGFVKYDDSICILPQGKHGLFADEVYDIRQLQNIRVVEPI